MKSLVAKRSTVIAGRKTSVSLEDALWKVLKEIASECDITVSSRVSGIHLVRCEAKRLDYLEVDEPAGRTVAETDRVRPWHETELPLSPIAALSCRHGTKRAYESAFSFYGNRVCSRSFAFVAFSDGKPVSTHSAPKTRVNALVIKSPAGLFLKMLSAVPPQALPIAAKVSPTLRDRSSEDCR